MAYEQMTERLGELETAIQAAQDAGENAEALIAEALALETEIEQTPEWEALIERLG